MAEALTSTVTVPWIVVALLALAVLLLIAVIWSIRRHRDPTLRINSDASIDELMPSLAGLTQSTIYRGNRVDLFENGAFFEMMFEEIAAARHSVHFETFLWKDGVLARRLLEALLERRRAGVEVRVLLDGNGGKKRAPQLEDRLREAGARFALHHPASWHNIGVFNERDHRKIIIIDGRVALVGGHCIVDSWLGDAQTREHVRDLAVRVRGPGVHGVQAAFSENWVEDTGELIVGAKYFPELEVEGDTDLHVASLKPEGSAPAVKVLHHLAICVARKRIWIQNPYFLPDEEAIQALAKAVKRGVDVRVMVPSTSASDMPIVQLAAQRNFDRLLSSGVRVFEYQRCLLHQKVMSIDGVWCAIGSSNFDDRSFETNDEITLGILDAALAQQLERVFEADCRQCVELDLARWRRRGLHRRATESVLHAFNELL